MKLNKITQRKTLSNENLISVFRLAANSITLDLNVLA